jgi:DNA-binding PadR family transcriptional regulator
MKLSATAKVILGMLAARPRSGYQIKQLVDKSTSFFWAASYSQIYPELKRLAEAGLIEGTDASKGARPRTVYKLTASGKAAFRDWIERPPEVFELRDEGLLRLFFAGVPEPSPAAEVARDRAAYSAAVASQLREIEATVDAAQDNGAPYSPDQASSTVLRFGIELNEWIADWFERAAGELAKTSKTKIERTS